MQEFEFNKNLSHAFVKEYLSSDTVYHKQIYDQTQMSKISGNLLTCTNSQDFVNNLVSNESMKRRVDIIRFTHKF